MSDPRDPRCVPKGDVRVNWCVTHQRPAVNCMLDERDQRIAELEAEKGMLSSMWADAERRVAELAAQVATLREVLGKISEIRYGLDDTATDAESLDYWANLAIEYRTIALAALAATPVDCAAKLRAEWKREAVAAINEAFERDQDVSPQDIIRGLK